LRLGGQTVEKMTPLEFLKTYLQLHGVSKERTEMLVQRAREVIQAE
jgi:hypothetical protein